MLSFITSMLVDGRGAPPGRDEHCLWAGLCLPYNLQRPSVLGTPTSLPEPPCPPAAPPPLLCSLGAPAITPLKATHRMWSAMELPLLRNVYCFICQIHESELLTERLARGIGCGEGGPLSWSWSAPMTPSVTWEPLRPPTLPGS